MVIYTQLRNLSSNPDGLLSPVMKKFMKLHVILVTNITVSSHSGELKAASLNGCE